MASGATSGTVRNLINGVADKTGVYAAQINASAPSAGTFALSMDYGSSQSISIAVLSGSVKLSTGAEPGLVLAPNTVEDPAGEGPVISINSVRFTGRGRAFRVTLSYGQFEFNLGVPTDPAATSSYARGRRPVIL